MKDILNKLDIGMKMFIVAIFGISVIYCILSVVFGLFKDEDKDNRIDIENISGYISIYSEDTGDITADNSKLVRSYNEFYTVQSALKNYIDAILDENYSNTYSVLSSEMTSKYSKSEYIEKITNLANKNLLNSDDSYDSEYCLNRAYKIGDMTYLCECKTISDIVIKIGLRLDSINQTYEVFYIDFNN